MSGPSPASSASTPPDATRVDGHPWLFAALATAAAVGARVAIQPLLGDAAPFVFAFPAVALVALRHGARPALVTAGLSAAWSALPFVPPRIAPSELPLQIAVFAISAVITALICAQFPERRSGDAPAAPLPVEADTALVRWLRAVLWGAVLIPLIAFAATAWWGYQRALADASRTVQRANAVVAEQAERTFATAAEIAARVNELVAGPDAELRLRSSELNRRFADIAIGRPGVLAISAWDEQGQLLASNRPPPHGESVSIADRDYFQALRRDGVPLLVTERMAGRLTGRQIFNAVTRRHGSDGRFAGVVVVALDPGYFFDFYRSLAAEEPGLNSFSLFKADGALLTRWPDSSSSAYRVPEKSPLLPLARAHRASGILVMQSSFDTEKRLMSYRRVGDLPVYVTAGLSEVAILGNWYRFLGLVAAVLVPATAALVYVALLALRKTRREQQALASLQAEAAWRAQAERALMQSQKMEALGQLTGGVAHDFNNLLAVVSNNVHLLKRMELGDRVAGKLAAISRAVDGGVKLTRQLLSFARKQALRPELIRLQEWLPGVEELLRTTAGRAVALHIDVDTATSPILVDTAELELALINLAVNAKDAMPDGGFLRITARDEPAESAEEGARTVIRVADSGTGVAPADLPRVFEPFFTTKPPGKGSGLGLSQVYGLCVQAGGKATIESSASAGTTVSLTFPARPPTAIEAAPQKSDLPPRLVGAVLLVEDNDALAESQSALIASAGASVTRARNAEAALAALAEPGARFDLVLSDISMPGAMDGIQLAFHLRRADPSLPVILTTGFAARVHEATAAGFRVLSKPARAAELFEELERIIGADRKLAASP